MGDSIPGQQPLDGQETVGADAEPEPEPQAEPTPPPWSDPTEEETPDSQFHG